MANGQHLLTGDFYVSTSEPIIKPPKLKKGTVLNDQFIVIRKLSEGSTCLVYQAMDNHTNLKVALKIVNMNCQAAVRRLFHEKRVYDSIDDCKYITKCFGMNNTEVNNIPVIYLIKEYAPSGSLEKWLSKNKEDYDRRLNEGLEVFKQCSKAVRSLHCQGFVIVDLSPSNFVKIKKQWKLCDLGMANNKALGIECDVGPDKWGTPSVMPPEAYDVATFAELETWSDCWAMAAILYLMLSPEAMPPFYAESLEQMKQLQAVGKPKKINTVEPYLWDVIEKGLSRYPSDRHESLEHFLCEIDNNNPEVITQKVRSDNYKLGKSLYNEKKYIKAASFLKKVLSEHDNYEDAVEILTDISSRYEQVNGLARQINESLENDILIARELHKEALVIYPDHGLLRCSRAKLLAVKKKVEHLYKQFSLSLTSGDLKSLEETFRAMEEIDYWHDHTCQARRIINEIDKTMDEMDSLLTIAESTHDYSYSMQVHDKYGKALKNILADSKTKLLSQTNKQLPAGEE